MNGQGQDWGDLRAFLAVTTIGSLSGVGVSRLKVGKERGTSAPALTPWSLAPDRRSFIRVVRKNDDCPSAMRLRDAAPGRGA